MRCLPSTTSLPSTGSICAQPTSSKARSQRSATAPCAPRDVSHYRGTGEKFEWEFIPLIFAGGQRHGAFPYSLRGNFMLSDTGLPVRTDAAGNELSFAAAHQDNKMGVPSFYFDFRGKSEVTATCGKYLGLLQNLVAAMA